MKVKTILLMIAILFVTLWASQSTLLKDKLNQLFPPEPTAAILMDFDNGEILYEKNVDQQLPVASMTKIMVEYLVLQSIDQNQLSWQSKVPISDEVYTISNNPNFSNVPLQKGTSYTVKELYQAMAIHSANGATIALAEKIGGTEKKFVEKMNETAKSMGLDHTRFVNSTGLNNSDLGDFYPTGSPSEGNRMSAKDVAHLAQKLIRNYPEVLDVSDKAVAVFNQDGKKPNRYYSTNLMLPNRGFPELEYPGVDGLKTGYTGKAGYVFTGTAKQSNERLISVVMGTQSKLARFEETKELFDYGFDQLAE
ncbi:D-alanyl-D-alanine carboxypeptidase family protein [Lentibacillus salicampi]|uniref:D-alanyl-D-alanine carboxypeptidase n=1 Tax=Lentibacillus salicampi TaxID=175306 RepID=A0A4Y9AD91_9BACI|nr:D-alanyl-D-alanine carboxypeptidase family protein [Lentibacillus salicampi]TFJ92374.1 D-alanyl-D-alanine carboxypeptidase [Lentibacillus salicampi]